MKELIVYWASFSFISFLLIIVIGLLFVYLANKITSESIVYVALGCALIILFLTIGIVPYYCLEHFFGFYPLGYTQKMELPIEPTENIKELNQKSQSLKILLESPEKLTLAEINRVIQDTLQLTTDLQIRTAKQAHLITTLQDEVKTQKQKTEDARQLTREVQSLTKEQIDAVRFLITQDAHDEAEQSSRKELIYFVVGIIIVPILHLIFDFIRAKLRLSGSAINEN